MKGREQGKMQEIEGTNLATLSYGHGGEVEESTGDELQCFDQATHRRLTVKDLPHFPTIEDLQEFYGGKDAVVERIQDDEGKTHVENVHLREELEREASLIYTELKKQEVRVPPYHYVPKGEL